MLTLFAFLLAIGLLITVHEYGHYRMAVACGVKVLRFSIGFGKVLWRWQLQGSATEFVIGALPLGGYVKMLDEREEAVDPAERHLAFNTQPLRSRVAIVAAGPLANLLLAVLLYACVNWMGVDLPAPVVAAPAPDSVAQRAGLKAGDTVVGAAAGADEPEPVESFEDLRWLLTQAALGGQDVRLVVRGQGARAQSDVVLGFAGMAFNDADAKMFQRIGVEEPFRSPVITEVLKGGAAERAGLQAGDVVERVGDVAVGDATQLFSAIRRSGQDADAAGKPWLVRRAGSRLELTVQPEVVQEGGQPIGKVGVRLGARPDMVTVRYGAFRGLWLGAVHTWEVSGLTLKMMGKMLVGSASLKNLSGPLTIADYAGKSASLGLTQYLVYLALVSVSLGVLNLLPLPILDGGHLMYYLYEGLSGKSVSDVWLDRLQRGGVGVLLIMMSIALFNDLTRLFG
jgi:regulator of sigma E protease